MKSTIYRVSAVLTAAGIAVVFMASGILLAHADEIDRSGGGPDTSKFMMSWGLVAGETPTFAIGTSVTDKFGNVYECPWYIPKSFGGCYNLTNTQYYLSQVHGFLNIVK